MNNAQINIRMWILISYPLAIYSEVGSLGHKVVLFLIVWGTSILFSVMAVPMKTFANLNRTSKNPGYFILPTICLWVNSYLNQSHAVYKISSNIETAMVELGVWKLLPFHAGVAGGESRRQPAPVTPVL